MKCINCNVDSNLKERSSHFGRCKSCGHPFVFEPANSVDQKMTDALFIRAIEKLSANNSLFFTPQQLLYFLNGKFQSRTFNRGSFLFTYLFFNIWVTVFFGGLTSIFGSALLSGLGIRMPSDFFFILINIIFQIISIVHLFYGTKSQKDSPRVRKSRSETLLIIGCLVLLFGATFGLIFLNSFAVLIIFVCLGTTSIVLGWRQLNQLNQSQSISLSPGQVQDWLNRWQQVNGEIPWLLPAPESQISSAPESTPVSPDVQAYSFDRLVVCDSDAIAQMLIANQFHFENNCAILSITGYPQPIFAVTMQMVRRNPDLKVYALHDCTPNSMKLADRLRSDSNWFGETNVVIIDVGLSPSQVIAARREIIIQRSASLPQSTQQTITTLCSKLSSQEIDWLRSGNYVTLESFSPQTLIRILQHSIAGSQNILMNYSDNFSNGFMVVGDSDNYLYTAESFG